MKKIIFLIFLSIYLPSMDGAQPAQPKKTPAQIVQEGAERSLEGHDSETLKVFLNSALAYAERAYEHHVGYKNPYSAFHVYEAEQRAALYLDNYIREKEKVAKLTQELNKLKQEMAEAAKLAAQLNKVLAK